MAMDRPNAEELVGAAVHFLESEIAPNLSGFNAFQMRVCMNALKIVERELQIAPGAETEERKRLADLIGTGDGDIDDLNRQLCTQIKNGDIPLDDQSLKDHLWEVTLAKLSVDQPKYKSYVRAIEQS